MLLHRDVLLFVLVLHTSSSSPLFTSLSLSCSCAADLCLLAQETWRSSPRCACVLSRSRAAPKCRAGWPWPWPHEAAGRIVVPGGPYQYYVVHQYSAVRRAWGASGVCMFLFFAPPTPPQNLVAALLSTPVRCIPYIEHGYANPPPDHTRI